MYLLESKSQRRRHIKDRMLVHAPCAMKRREFRLGELFWCAGQRWRCTDIGTRVIVAISIEPHEVVTLDPVAGEHCTPIERRHVTHDPAWLTGPPYAISEAVFDEHSMVACSKERDAVLNDEVAGAESAGCPSS